MPSTSSRSLSRRDVIRTSAVVAGFAALGSRRTYGAAAQNYTGDFVVASVQETAQAADTIAAIKTTYPGVNVVWRHLPSERFAELFTASEVAGDQIDLMDLNGQDLRRYAVGGRLADLSGVTFLDRFRPVATDTYTIGETLWALPRGGISGFTFFHNKAALAKIGATKPPQTYAELLAMAPDFIQAGIAPFTHPGRNIYLWPVWQFWAHAQTSGNRAVERTFETLAGDAKFTDPDHVQALEILYRFGQDGMFVENVNSLDTDAAWLQFTQGRAAFTYVHSSRIADYVAGDFPELDLGLTTPVQAVEDASVKRQLPGGTGSALAMYGEIDKSRRETANGIMDVMTSDTVVQSLNIQNGDAVSCNVNVTPSREPLALLYGEQCSPNQITYLDWYWPPEVTRSFQENQQALITGDLNPEQAAEAIQATLDDLYLDGYEFTS